MNFGFNEDQETIKRTAHEFLAARYRLEEVRRLAEDTRGFTDEQWQELAGLGWPGIFIAEEDGGQGLGVVELAIVQEEMGYALAPSPFFSNAAAGLVLAAAAEGDERDRYLRPLAAGEQRGTLALNDEDGGWDAREGSLEPDGTRLTGTKIAVPDAGSADFIVVATAGGGHFVVEPGTAGVEITETPGIDPTRKLFSVRLDGVEATALGRDEQRIGLAYAAISTALAAESVGVAQRTMEMAVEYAKDRKQFERPIGAYQAVSHRCAQMLLETEGARSASYYAAWAIDQEPESALLAASMAKAYASDAGWRVAASALQVHGGIGFTWEHDLHFFLKRATANAHAFGDSRHHRSRVAELVGV
jgi:alkylation response protein AidB-like acyl-CoA dehydrogenase